MSSSAEVNNATGEAPTRSDVVQALNDKRAALSAARERYATARTMRDEIAMSDETRLIDALKELIPLLETEAAGLLEAKGRKDAEDRLLGIKRAAGSVRSELKEDDKRVSELETELHEANAKRTARARKYESLQAETNALADRFDLPLLKLEIVPEPPPIKAPTPWEYRSVRPSFEACEHNLRQRRDYAEISGSDGYRIVSAAGLRAFRPLTERESEVLEDRAEERKLDPVLAQAVAEANALGHLRVPSGGVTRG